MRILLKLLVSYYHIIRSKSDLEGNVSIWSSVYDNIMVMQYCVEIPEKKKYSMENITICRKRLHNLNLDSSFLFGFKGWVFS